MEEEQGCRHLASGVELQAPKTSGAVLAGATSTSSAADGDDIGRREAGDDGLQAAGARFGSRIVPYLGG
jgi:hypothetical protein